MALGVALGLWRMSRKGTFRIVVLAPTRELSSAWMKKLSGELEDEAFADVLRIAGRPRRGEVLDYFAAYVPEFRRAKAQAVIYAARTRRDVRRIEHGKREPELARQLKRTRGTRRIEILVTSPRFLTRASGSTRWRKWARRADVVLADEAYGIRNDQTAYGRLLRPDSHSKSVFKHRPWLIALSATLLSKDMRDMRTVMSTLIEWRRKGNVDAELKRLRAACAKYSEVLNEVLNDAAGPEGRNTRSQIKEYREASSALEKVLRRYMSRIPTLKNRTYERWFTHQRSYREPVASDRTFPHANPQVEYDKVSDKLNVPMLKDDLGRFLFAVTSNGQLRRSTTKRSWLSLTEIEGPSGTDVLEWPKPRSLALWLREHIQEIARNQGDVPRFKVAVYCHHVRTAKTLGRRDRRCLSAVVKQEVRRAHRRLVASERALFAGSFTKPKPVLEAAFRRAHFTPAFLKALPGKNPTLLLAALLNARSHHDDRDKAGAFISTLGPSRPASKEADVLRILRRTPDLRARILRELDCRRLARRTETVSSTDKKERAALWHIFNNRRIREVLASTQSDKVLQIEAKKIVPLDMRTTVAAHIARLVLATLEQDRSIVLLLRKWNQNLYALRRSKELEDLDRNTGHRTSGILEVLTGENPERRVSVSRDFLTPGNPFLLIMTNVCSMGVDLHNYCWDVIHYSPSWTPSDFEQKSGRIDRPRPHALRRRLQIGQGRNSSAIRVHHFLWPFTYDERVFRRMNFRGHMSERLLSSKVVREADDRVAASFHALRPLSLAPA
jgi:hypothetical protein